MLILRILLIFLTLFSIDVVYASFGSGYFNCSRHSGLIVYVQCESIIFALGILITGLFIIPSIFFSVIHGLWCNPLRSRKNQIFIGTVVGILSVLVLIIIVPISQYLTKSQGVFEYGNTDSNVYIVIFIYYMVMAMFSYFYTRSLPK